MEVKVAATGLIYHDQPAVELVARDVSERKRVEEAIKSLAAFAEMNPNPVLEFTRDGTLTYSNEPRCIWPNRSARIIPGPCCRAKRCPSCRCA